MWARGPLPMRNIISQIETDIALCYGDILSPNYKIIADRLEKGPDYNEIKNILYNCYVNDSTESNYDTSFTYNIIINDMNVTCQLSVAGKYFCVFGEKNGKIFVYNHDDIVSNKNIYSALFDLMSYRNLLDLGQLESKIKLNNEESDDGFCMVYNALFSCDYPPWMIK